MGMIEGDGGVNGIYILYILFTYKCLHIIAIFTKITVYTKIKIIKIIYTKIKIIIKNNKNKNKSVNGINSKLPCCFPIKIFISYIGHHFKHFTLYWMDILVWILFFLVKKCTINKKCIYVFISSEKFLEEIKKKP